MARYCAACGTEVEDTAVFCPTCGQPIDQEQETEIPAAPAWPDHAEADQPAPDRRAYQRDERAPDEERDAEPDRVARVEEPTRVGEAATYDRSEPPPAMTPPPRRSERSSRTPSINLPLTMPVMLSAWLIGVGAIIAAIGVLISLFGRTVSAIDLIALLLLLGIAATVFFSSRIPEIPNLRLAILAVMLIGFGMALDRVGLGGAGIGELLFFFGTAAGAIGAVIVELGRDQPLGGRQP